MMLVCSSIVAMTLGEHSIMAKTALSKAEKIFVNPVINADYSDPDAVASPDGKTFYMTASSFQCTPGLPILKSHDLVNWRLVNYAIDAVPPTDVYSDGRAYHGKGVWAPSIKYHDGQYYIYWGDPDYGVFMIRTADPEGKWSEPVLVKAGKGWIDPTPFWDEDGRVWLANGWAASRCGFNSVITISEMNTEGTALISNPKIVYDGNDGVNHTVEGPKMYKRNGYYYLMAPAGGVATGWQLVMRSKNIYGPYESKIVMSQGNSDINGPHQGAWVANGAGQDWFLHFQDKGPFGRVVHLNPVQWINDWPVIGIDADGDGCGQPVDKYTFPISIENEDYSEKYSTPIERYFQWHANRADWFGFEIPDGLMRIYSHKLSSGDANLWEVPNLWMMKFPEEKFDFVADLKISSKLNSDGVSSGIVVMGYDYCRLGLTTRDGRFVVQLVECQDAEHGGRETVRDIASVDPRRYEAGLIPNIETDIKLKVSVNPKAECRLFYSLDGKKFNEIPGVFNALPGKWIGAKIGFYSIMPPDQTERGWIDVKEVRY